MDKLNLGQHISQRYNEELEEVRSKVLQMGGVVEEQLGNAVRALVYGNASLAAEVVTNDYRVNALEVGNRRGVHQHRRAATAGCVGPSSGDGRHQDHHRPGAHRG